MAREGIEVDAECGDVDRELRRRLGAVGEHKRARVVGHPRDLARSFSVPSTFETWATATSFGPRSSAAANESMSSSPSSVRRDPVDLGALPAGQLLPGHEVRVVLHLGEHDPVALADVHVAPGAGDEVDRLGGVADEDDLAAVAGADVVGHRRPGALVGRGRLGGERVGAAVDVRVVAALVAVDRLDRRQDALGAGARSRGRRWAGR